MSRQGKKNFNNCAVKVVDRSRYLRDDDGNTFIQYSTEETKPGDKSVNEIIGNGARLLCPRTEEGGILVKTKNVNFSDPEAAYRNLRDIAATMLCTTCVYGDMTPVQVSITRAEFANAETERILAFQRLEEARAEVAAIAGPAQATLDKSTNQVL